MQSKTTILVTGSTGQAGAEVCAALSNLPDIDVRAGFHTPEKRDRLPSGVTPVPFDTDDPATVSAALEGADKLFLLTPGGPMGPPATRVIIDAAKASDVRYIVKLSSLDPERPPQAPTDLWALETENMVRDTGIPHTFLRPPWFFQNFHAGYFLPMLMQRVLALPFGDGRAGWLDSRDLAAMVARLMTEDGHDGKIYTPTGPVTITLHDIAAAFSAATGQEIRYKPLTDEEWVGAMTATGAPPEAAYATLALMAKTRDGLAADLTDDVELVTGQKPRSLETFVKDHQEVLSAIVSSS